MSNNMLNKEDQEKMESLAFQILEKMQSEGVSLQEAIGMDDKLLEEIYSLAYGYYNQGKYEESVSLFYFLAGISPKTFKFVFGLAASYYQQKDYVNALTGFAISTQIDSENPLSTFYIADCFFKQGFDKEGLEFLDFTIALCADFPKHAALKERSLLIKKSYKK